MRLPDILQEQTKPFIKLSASRPISKTGHMMSYQCLSRAHGQFTTLQHFTILLAARDGRQPMLACMGTILQQEHRGNLAT
jgi:hypothetical protein